MRGSGRSYVALVGLILMAILGFVWVVRPVFIKQSVVDDSSERTLGFTCTRQTCQAMTRTPPTSCDGFVEDEIDLTGDGISEQIRRTGKSVCIFQDNTEVWCSPYEWQVVDFALGDPNDDGRYEILLAFWEENAQGVLHSQPFIVGYREGQYRTVWGGSPVSEPIHEVALGDVDGDGTQNLVLLDAAGEAGRAVSVWRWYGWGFSLMWRSAVGHYRCLTVVPRDVGEPAVIAVKNTP